MGIVLQLLFAVLVLGCDEQEDGKPKDEVASGRALFMRNGCALCHGEAGRGDGRVAASLKPPPRDFSDMSAYKQGNEQEAIAQTIKSGVPGSTMPGYPHLASEERRLIAAFIRSLQNNQINK